MLQSKFSSALIVINDSVVLRTQWKQVASECGFNLTDRIDQYHKTKHDGISITVQALTSDEHRARLLHLGATLDLFGVVDESHRSNKAINTIVSDLLSVNEKSRFLFVAGTTPSAADSFGAQFRFNTEYFFQESILRRPETKIQIVPFAPSFSLLSTLVDKHKQIDDLSWREFEKLISELLERDGYEVELMRGTKDGGVDVVALKDMGSAGIFKTLWQAKKKEITNKVGLSVVRELADTTRELKASKGIIVTSTYLTSGALARIERDKYILSKIDRDDLDQWIHRVFFERDGHRRGFR